MQIMRVSKTTAIIALIGTLASATAKADCYQVTVDQAGIPLYRCDQPTQVVQQAPVIVQGASAPVYNGNGELITGAIIGTVAGVLLATAINSNHGHYDGGRGYGRDYGRGRWDHGGRYGR